MELSLRLVMWGLFLVLQFLLGTFDVCVEQSTSSKRPLVISVSYVNVAFRTTVLQAEITESAQDHSFFCFLYVAGSSSPTP